MPSAKDALRLFAEQPEAYDLLFTDQSMPGMTGIQLAEEVRRIRPDLPIVLCSDYSESLASDASDLSGVSAFLEKPINQLTLAQTLRRALDQSSPDSTS